MNKPLSCILALTFGVIVSAQSSLKKGDRPVFYSAGNLAAQCKMGGSINNGEPVREEKTYNMSIEQLVGEARCEAYLDGVLDEELENLGPQYNPVPSRVANQKTLIDVLVKYVADHPEEGNLAASTVLAKVEKIVADAQKPR